MALNVDEAMAAYHRAARESNIALDFIERELRNLPFSSADVRRRIERMTQLMVGSRIANGWPLIDVARWAIDELTAEWAGTARNLDHQPARTTARIEEIFESGHWSDYCALRELDEWRRQDPNAEVWVYVHEAREWGLYGDTTRCECGECDRE